MNYLILVGNVQCDLHVTMISPVIIVLIVGRVRGSNGFALRCITLSVRFTLCWLFNLQKLWSIFVRLENSIRSRQYNVLAARGSTAALELVGCGVSLSMQT